MFRILIEFMEFLKKNLTNSGLYFRKHHFRLGPILQIYCFFVIYKARQTISHHKNAISGHCVSSFTPGNELRRNPSP